MPELDFSIVDAHIHLWDPRTTPRAVSPLVQQLGHSPELLVKEARANFPPPIRAFLGVPDALLFPYLPADHARDAAAFPVDTVVHIEAGWMDHAPLAAADETRWVASLFGAVGTQLGAIVAYADLRAENCDALLAAHVEASQKVRGVRQMAAHHPDPSIFNWNALPNLLRDAAFLRGFERLEARGLRFDAFVYSNQLADVGALAQRFPKVPIVLDHVGTPVGAAGPVNDVAQSDAECERIRASWRDELAKLAEHKNVWVKLSGLTMPILGFGFHRRPSPPSVDELHDALGPYLRHALDVFGVERSFFASNFPMDRPSAPYERIFEAYLRCAQERGPSAPRVLLRDNALRFYGIESA